VNRLSPLLLAAGLVACAHGDGAKVPRSRVLPLRPGAQVLAIDGTLAGAPVEIRFAVEEPRSLVSRGCYPTAPAAQGQVRLPQMGGGWITLPEFPLSGLALGGEVLPPFPAALVSEPSGCLVQLGLDVLGHAVLDIDLDTGTVTLSPGPPTLPKDVEQVSVDLSRAPDTDRLLVPAQLTGSAATALQTVFLGTARPTELAAVPARALGAESVLRVVQLAPGWEACDVSTRPRTDWSRPPGIGLLGVEGWGARRMLLELGAPKLVLVRPKGAPPPPCRDTGSSTPIEPVGPKETEPK
jgi:hypothetical protein